KVDKPFQTEVQDILVTADGDSWRVERKRGNGPLAIHLAHLPKQDIRGYAVQVRFKMKTEKVAGYAPVELRLGGKPAAIKNDVSPTTDWKSYALTSQVTPSAVEDIDIFAGVNGTGTIWLKEIEVVKIGP